MFSFTKHERLVLWVLLGVLAGGGGLHWVGSRFPQADGLLHFMDYVNDQARVDINTATAEDLVNIPGIGPGLAKRILEYRATHGGFHSLQQLKEIPGIGVKKYEVISTHMKIGGR